MYKYIIIALIIMLPLLFITVDRSQRGGTLMSPFSLLDEPQMEGIEASWANKENPKNTERPVVQQDKKITYYGHGIPLYPVEPGVLLDPMKLPHNTNIATSPSCCPSPYSSDQGCYCGAIEDIQKALSGR